jgi:hypothetical protein
MKKGLALTLAAAVASMVLTVSGRVPVSSDTAKAFSVTSSYRAVAIPEDVQADLRAKGMSVSEHLPASLVKGPHAINTGKAAVGTAPTADNHNALALYLKFPDDDQPLAAAAYQHIPANLLQDLLFGDSYNPYTMDQFKGYASFNGAAAPLDRTLKNYYKGVSQGRVTVTGSVVEVTMPHGYSYYKIGQPYGVIDNNANGDYTMALIFKDAIETADPYVDFSKYAVNGEVPDIFLIHQGTGSEFSTDPAMIWSHSWDYMDAAYFN